MHSLSASALSADFLYCCASADIVHYCGACGCGGRSERARLCNGTSGELRWVEGFTSCPVTHAHRGSGVVRATERMFRRSVLLVLMLVLHAGSAFVMRGAAPRWGMSRTVLSPREALSSEMVETIFQKAASKALDGGAAGASAAACQVLALMWLRTALNYQYRFGTSTGEALRTLWAEGGILRLYQGLPFALVQGPLSRFGDTASNALMLSIVDSLDPLHAIPLFAKTGLGSLAAGVWRVVLMPVDTAKTSLQVNGEKGLDMVLLRVSKEGPSALFSGALAASAATVVGHYPWFLTYNTLSASLPTAQQISAMGAAPLSAGEAHNALIAAIAALHLDPQLLTLCRSAFIGLCASSISDVCSNSLRVLKTTRQTQAAGSSQSYLESARAIIAKEGWGGLLGRGLQTRLLANALQGTLFSVLFKYFQKG